MTKKILLTAVLFAAPMFANSLYWYNGDSSGGGNIADERGGQFGDSYIYDDFNVGAAGVDITGLIAYRGDRQRQRSYAGVLGDPERRLSR